MSFDILNSWPLFEMGKYFWWLCCLRFDSVYFQSNGLDSESKWDHERKGWWIISVTKSAGCPTKRDYHFQIKCFIYLFCISNVCSCCCLRFILSFAFCLSASVTISLKRRIRMHKKWMSFELIGRNSSELWSELRLTVRETKQKNRNYSLIQSINLQITFKYRIFQMKCV